jgi:uncharacterized membrane protein YiaA
MVFLVGFYLENDLKMIQLVEKGYFIMKSGEGV